MLNLRQFLRMSRWAQSPPSAKRVKMVVIVLLICAVLFGIERIFGWPEFLTLPGNPRGRIF